jgi:uncharacterized coiled-coil DUF342 family protein
MSIPIEPLNMHGHANTWEEELQEVAGERDELRARIKELEAERDSLLMTSLSRFDEIELLGRERDELRAFQADIFEVYGGNYEPEGRLADLSRVIERAMYRHD